jgi:hypothetical protein
MAGTEGAIFLMTQMLSTNDVNGLQADMWLMSLSLIQAPTSGMLDSVASLLKMDSLQVRLLKREVKVKVKVTRLRVKVKITRLRVKVKVARSK